MSKLMTIYMAFDALERGQLTEEMTLPVSEHAMSYKGSSMFLNTLDRPTVHDLLRGIIVLSGNDASAVIAEALSPDGTEAGFARLMNEKAQEIGLTHSHFVNSNGWPAEGQVMTAHDLGVLAERLIEDFPDRYELFSEQEFTFDGRVPSNSQNRNPILGLGIGADGLKTGHTEEAGYGLVGSAKQDDRRIIFVVTGLPSMDARRTEGGTHHQLGLPPVRPQGRGRGRDAPRRGRGLDGRRAPRGPRPARGPEHPDPRHRPGRLAGPHLLPGSHRGAHRQGPGDRRARARARGHARDAPAAGRRGRRAARRLRAPRRHGGAGPDGQGRAGPDRAQRARPGRRRGHGRRRAGRRGPGRRRAGRGRVRDRRGPGRHERRVRQRGHVLHGCIRRCLLRGRPRRRGPRERRDPQ
ncbi:D-alanyl-D-alanine carboxypeptidase [Rubellimicrobium mesophilum DSM 19309]|uniref:D-alanyl-D-alanine carboxypeptidase n=1 Tax=Rubellimicrobium mesophilum DSM 19309 TaxID=442562 RepID=A0A017HTB2_9RHOB|nr:D-alanyl-D-alanine carboxypeptidase [Rubellimicrobium mesophilum DSM 19309]